MEKKAQQDHPVPFQMDENKKIVLSTKDTSLGGLLPASVILNNYLKLDPKEFTAMLENSKKMLHFLLSDIDINDPHAVIVKTIGRMEYLITRNRSLVQVLSSMQKALFECNERLTEKETRCETLQQQVREQTEAFQIEWKTSYEGTLKKAVAENKARQDYFLHNDFEQRLEQQKAEYEKSVATYEKDRKDLIKENANLMKDKDNLEKQLSAFKKREKQFLSLLLQHKIKGPDSDDDDSEDHNDVDDDDEDWNDVATPEAKSKSKSGPKSKVKVSKIEPIAVAASIPQPAEDNVVYSSANLLEADLSLSDSEEEGFGVDYREDRDSKEKGASCKSEWIDAKKTRYITNQAAGIITELLMHSKDEIIKTVGLTESFKFLASLPPRNVVVALYEHLIKNCGQALCIMDVLSKDKNKLMEDGKTIYDLMYAYMLDEIIPCRKVQFKDIIELYAIGGFLGYVLKIRGVGKIDDVIWKCLFWRPPDAITIFMALFRVNSDYYNEFDFNDKSRPLRDRVAAFCIERMPVQYQSSRYLELRMFVNKALNWKNVPKDMQIKDLFETIMPEIMGMEHEKALEMATDILTFICVIYGHESFPYFRDQLIKVTQRWMAHEVNDGVYAAVIRAIGEMAKKSIEVLTPAQLKPLKEFLETASQHNENSVVVKDAYAVALVSILTTSNDSKTRKQVVFPLLVDHQSKKSLGKRPIQEECHVRRGGKRGWGRGGRGGGGSSGTKN